MKDFSRLTQAYILGVITLATVLGVWQFSQASIEDMWMLLAACAIASFLQSLSVFGATARSTYSISWIIYAFILVLQGPAAAMIVILVSHVVEWLLDPKRLAWYIQSFNVGNFFIVVAISDLIIGGINAILGSGTAASFFAIVTALAAFTFLNHFLVALVIKLARGQTFTESGVFGWFTLFLDFTLLCLGFMAAIIWLANPAGLMLVVFVTYLLYEALKIPALERKTEIDPKTQLYNARYFTEALDDEMIRSKRFKRPLSLIMADLDFLRTINNNYGHLAGDVVLQGIADVLQEMTREYDIVSRFGGEEFSVLLPETELEDAYIVAERVRKRIEETEFVVSTSVDPIRATMSFGIAGLEGKEQTTDSLIHNADVALYRAKETGRNRTCIYDKQIDAENGIKKQEWTKLGTINKRKTGASSETHQNGHVAETPPPPATNRPPTASESGEPLQIERAEEMASSERDNAPQTAASYRPVPQRNYPNWAVSVYIFGLFTVTAALSAFLLGTSNGDINWSHILFFAGIVIVMEVFSIEIYVQDTTVSTSASLLVAGILLFDAPAAIVLGSGIAIVTFAKRRIKLSRLVFNLSNHIFGSLIVVALIGFSNHTIETWSLLQLLMVGAGAAGIIYLSTTFYLSIAIGLDTGLPFKSIWMERFRWLAPYYLALGLIAATMVFSYLTINITGILIIILPLLMLRYSQKQYIDHTESLVRDLRSTNKKLKQQSDEITRLNEEMLLTLARSLDLRDPYVMEHSKHVSRYATLMAKEMALPAEQIENIRKAGLLHDIGKLGVPEEILFKPGRLTATEYALVKEHVTIGADLIQGCHSLEPLVPFILHHHEWYDGNGYPHGLAGTEIPLEARILSVADAVEAMASDRPYKAGSSPEAILAEVERCVGTQFDPVVAKAFGRIIAREGRSVIVNSARITQEQNKADTETFPPHY